MSSLHTKILALMMLASMISGCGQRQDKDLTDVAEYNFKSFSGTVWKTKRKVALADLKRYTGRHDTAILPPRSYDPKDPNYSPAVDMKVISELPIGTKIRIERLYKDSGIAGLIWITGSLEDGKTVYISHYLLSKNRFLQSGDSDSGDWAGDKDHLERVVQ